MLQLQRGVLYLATGLAFTMLSGNLFAAKEDSLFGSANIELPELGEPLYVAQADTSSAEPEAPVSEECQAFLLDPDADVGAIIRAGCQPTTAQMSELMDNPLGNVAMLFTQFDWMFMENPSNGEEANKGNYMGIFQFPKRLNDDWNLINRVIWNVPSMPLDQDKIDDFDPDEYLYSSGSGPSVVAPNEPLPAPIDLFDGRTTGFGDMYYVGLFSPSTPIEMGEGNVVWGLGFDVGLPTATDDVLGTGKYTAGPSALGVYLGPKWKVGGCCSNTGISPTGTRIVTMST